MAGRNIRTHVTIDGTRYILAQGLVEKPYSYHAIPIAKATNAGKPQGEEEELLPDLNEWVYDDWSGGQGYDFFRKDDPIVYLEGRINNRRSGKIKPPPNVTLTALSANLPAANEPLMMATAVGIMWMAQDERVYSSTDGITWTSRTTGFAAGYNITSLAGDATYLYIAANNGSLTSVQRITTTTQEEVVAPVALSQLVSMVVSGAYLFSLLAGGNISKIDTTAVMPESLGSPIYTIGNVTASSRSKIVKTDTGIAIMDTAVGATVVHELPGPDFVGSEAWILPNGFSGRSMCFTASALWVLGSNSGLPSIYGFPLTTRQEIDVGFIKGSGTLTPRIITSGIGKTVLIGFEEGSVYIYDIGNDAISLLDDTPVSGKTLHDLNTYEGLRLAGFQKSSSTWAPSVRMWADDYIGAVDASLTGVCTSPLYNFGIPGYDKVLHSVRVAYSPITTAGHSILVEYSLDGAAYVTAGTINSTNGTTGRITFIISVAGTTKKFRQMQFRLTLTNTQAEVHSISWIAQVPEFLETWDLIIFAGDEKAGNRPGGLQRAGWKIRDTLLVSLANRNVISFIDHYRYPKKNQNATINVLIKECFDQIGPKGEGLLMLKLVKVQ
jgi:hypothetical protein